MNCFQVVTASQVPETANRLNFSNSNLPPKRKFALSLPHSAPAWYPRFRVPPWTFMESLAPFQVTLSSYLGPVITDGKWQNGLLRCSIIQPTKRARRTGAVQKLAQVR